LEGLVAIAGAGPAGCATATALARIGIPALLLDTLPRRKILGESLPPAARPLLSRLGLEDALLARSQLRATGQESAWGSEQLRSFDFVFTPYGHGWHVDRVSLDEDLRTNARRAGATVYDRVSRIRWERIRDRWRVNWLSADEKGHADVDVIVDCTGRAARLARERPGNRRLVFDCLVAVVRRTQENGTDASRVELEAVREGWWYTAPTPRGRVFALFSDADLLVVRQAQTLRGWQALMSETRHIRGQAAEACFDGEAIVVSARTTRLDQISGDGWLAVGDAACTRDPLSSQGVLAALSQGRRAAEAILDHLGGRTVALRGYSEDLEAEFRRYRRTQIAYYGLENRWPRADFWRRRHNALVE
jgi:flavin-dependent dehydrogenase